MFREEGVGGGMGSKYQMVKFGSNRPPRKLTQLSLPPTAEQTQAAASPPCPRAWSDLRCRERRGGRKDGEKGGWATMVKFRQQTPLQKLTQLSLPSRGPNSGSCFSFLSLRLQQFKMLIDEGEKEGRIQGRKGSDKVVCADLK